MSKLTNPIPLFLDGRGALLDAGYIYIGEVGTDPEVVANQLDLYWDKALTIPAVQPLRTMGGVITNAGDIAFVYFAEPDFSTVIRDADSQLVAFIPTAYDLGGVSYQPLDADLTAIAALASTAYGRSLLTLANQAALQVAVGITSVALMPEATAANFRANVADRVLSTDQTWGAAAAVALAEAAGAVAVDLNAGINFTLAMTGSPWTLSNPTNGKAGQSGVIEISQDAAGNRLLTYGANWKFLNGVDPVLSTGANAKDLLFYQVLANGSDVFASLAKAVA